MSEEEFLKINDIQVAIAILKTPGDPERSFKLEFKDTKTKNIPCYWKPGEICYYWYDLSQEVNNAYYWELVGKPQCLRSY